MGLWHKAGSALGAHLEPGQELVMEEHVAETEVMGWPARGTPNARRRPKQPLPKAREEDAELSMAGMEPGAGAGLTLPTRGKAAPMLTPKGCSLPGPEGDVSGPVISRRERRKGVGWLGRREALSIPQKAFGQTRWRGSDLLPPWLLFTDPLGPAWVLLLLSAQITLLTSALLIAEGQSAAFPWPPRKGSFCRAAM